LEASEDNLDYISTDPIPFAAMIFMESWEEKKVQVGYLFSWIHLGGIWSSVLTNSIYHQEGGCRKDLGGTREGFKPRSDVKPSAEMTHEIPGRASEKNIEIYSFRE